MLQGKWAHPSVGDVLLQKLTNPAHLQGRLPKRWAALILIHLEHLPRRGSNEQEQGQVMFSSCRCDDVMHARAQPPTWARTFAAFGWSNIARLRPRNATTMLCHASKWKPVQ